MTKKVYKAVEVSNFKHDARATFAVCTYNESSYVLKLFYTYDEAEKVALEMAESGEEEYMICVILAVAKPTPGVKIEKLVDFV